MILFDDIKKIVKKRFEDNLGSHDWDHTYRVLNMAQKLAKLEGADMEIVSYAALLHDIKRHEEDQLQGAINHEEEGAKEARLILTNLGLEEEKIEKIASCIMTHRFRKARKPESLEAKILFDADKLDGIGAIGIGRAFVFAGEIGARVHDPDIILENTRSYTKDDTAYREYLVKLSKLKDRLYTKSAKDIAQDRHNFMVAFFERINLESKGLK